MTTLLDSLKGTPSFALVDPILCPDARSGLTAEDQVMTLPITGVAASSHDVKNLLPFLLPLRVATEAQARRYEALEEWALDKHAITWLQSNLPVETLASELSRRFDIVLSDNQPALLRISDARVLMSVHATLPESQRDSFFSPVSSWWCYDRQERLQRLWHAEVSTEHTWPTPWRISPTQEGELLTAAEPDTVLALLREQAASLLEAIPRQQRHRFICDQINKATHWGLDDISQQMLYCFIALDQGDDFADRPAWREMLTKVRERKLNLTEAITLIEQGTS